MNWSDFYLLCFLVGFSLSVLSFLAGAVHIHLPFKMHLPFHAANHGGAGASHGGLKASAHISWFNASSAMAFLAWFGGTGYLLTRHSHLLAVVSLALATLVGLSAGWVVFRFMVKLMSSTDSPMKSEDYRIEGSVGTVSMPIRESGGTGEIIFSMAGVRRCSGARCDDGEAIEKGAEVVIERYEKGIAYVKRWEEFTK
jgi:membrane protein implicated in regulation of membrane protease activity